MGGLPAEQQEGEELESRDRDGTEHYLTRAEMQALLGVGHMTLERWHHEGRLYKWHWTRAYVEAHRHELQKRPRGPQKGHGGRPRKGTR